MSEIEGVIRLLATILGIIMLAAPILFVFRQARRARGRSSGKGSASRSWYGVLLMAMGFVGLGYLLWQPISRTMSDQMKLILSAAGAIFYFPGVGVYLWGIVTMGSQFGVSTALGADLYKEHKLIANGPFALVRHPMYAGVILAAIGGLLIFRTWAMVVFMPMSWTIVARAEREEKLLAQEFGDEWEAYASKVPKWFPKLSR